jgi:EAL domain-containing protein (putative c-di-GMP-specific phosphodiesterase class I)
LIEVTQGTSAKDAVSTADRACREAKKGQHAGLVVYDKDSRVFREHEAEMQLVERLASNQSIEGLFIEMQPIMSLRAPYQSLNFEVLLRMHDENGNRVPTDRLIHAGENAGRMDVIDRWVLSTTLDWLRQHAADLGHNQFVCMNLSGASLNDENFMEDVFTMLDRNREIASKLCLEITESVALHDLGNTRRFIDKTRSYGTKVALDDFGAGYTSFSYLKDLPADLLKIDGSFIVNMNHHPANVAIVEAIVSLAQNLGMKTVAEWAEDFETVETLAEIGVDYVQGFVVARPQNPADMLNASSSASFIKDEALGRYISTLAPEDSELANVDLVLGQDFLRAA